ncbi:hypothetical protein VTH06DRAFT_4771 [Thermothelomyces fergusii]
MLILFFFFLSCSVSFFFFLHFLFFLLVLVWFLPGLCFICLFMSFNAYPCQLAASGFSQDLFVVCCLIVMYSRLCIFGVGDIGKGGGGGWTLERCMPGFLLVLFFSLLLCCYARPVAAPVYYFIGTYLSYLVAAACTRGASLPRASDSFFRCGSWTE